MKKIVNTTPPESISLQEVSDNFMAYTIFAKCRDYFIGLVIFDKETSKFHLSRGVWDRRDNSAGYTLLEDLIEQYDGMEFYAQKDVEIKLL